MQIRTPHVVTALAVATLALAGCEQGAETGEIDEEPYAEDTVGLDEESDFEAEAREAGEEIEEGIEEGVDAVGAGTERLGEKIQESVDDEERDDETP